MAVDTIARALALSVLGADGNVSPDKLPGFDTEDPTTFTVGGLESGTNINGKSIYEILQLILYGEVVPDYPTLVSPSFSLENLPGLVGVVGSSFVVSGNAIFNRGQIYPAYGTSGYRSGAPVSYNFNGQVESTSELNVPFLITLNNLSQGSTQVTVSVNYEAGEQPLDSMGGDYNSPYPAGTLTQYLDVLGIYPIFTSSDGEQDLTENALLTTYFSNATGTGFEVTIAGEDMESGEKQVFALYSGTPAVGVQQYDELRHEWDWIYGTPEDSLTAFTPGETTLEVSGISVTYTTYTNALEAVGERNLKIFTQIPE